MNLLLEDRIGNHDDLTCKVALAVDGAKLGGILLLKSVLGKRAEKAQVPSYERPAGRCRQLSDCKPEHTQALLILTGSASPRMSSSMRPDASITGTPYM